MSSVSTTISPFDGDQLSESDPRCKLIGKYLNIFSSRLESGIKRESESAWRFMSKYHTLTEQEVEQAIDKSGSLFRAFSVEARADFIVISFPAKSTYHSANFVSNIKSALKARGINTSLYEFQDDWFMFVYFGTQVETAPLCELFANWCDSLGMKTGADGILIHEVGSLVPFPLQSGFYWLNDRCQKLVRRDELSLEKSLCFLFAEAAQSKNDPEVFKNTFKISALSARAKRAKLFPSATVESTAEPTDTLQFTGAEQDALADVVEDATSSNISVPTPGSVQMAS
jgi:hypothetical protein